MKIKIFFLSIFIAVTQFTIIPACFADDVKFPNYSDYVNDYMEILSEDARYKLSSLFRELEQKTTAQAAIVTIESTHPLNIEAYAVKLFEKWAIGQKNKDNGVLLLVAMNDRTVRIEVGYGLEGAIPDALAKNIIEAYILPHFKTGSFELGVIKGGLGIANLIAKEYNVELSEFENFSIDAPSLKERSRAENIINLLFTLFIIMLFLSLRLGSFWWWLFLPRSYRRRNGYWYGGGFGGNSGGFGGGFGGFGGGMSGGGGASGKW